MHCLARHPAVLGQLLHPGDEGRDPDTAPNPDLDWTLVLEGERAIGTFEHHLLVQLQRLRQARRMIAKCLGDEHNSRFAGSQLEAIV